MNRTKNELADYAWNPVTGCLKDCRYCYAKKSALRFASDWRRNLAERPKVQQVGADLFELDAPWETANNRFLNNPTGFKPTLHRYRLDWPQKVKVGSTIMACTDGDLFGPWVPEDWILRVFAAADEAPQHQYIFLTQYPERYKQLVNHEKLPQNKNFWYGSTATVRESSVWANEHYNTFVAIEPLLGPFEGNVTKAFQKLKWVIIGAETGRNAGKVIPNYGLSTIRRAINRYGTAPQLQMAIKEMSELTKAICNLQRAVTFNYRNGAKIKVAHESVREEIADVYIMLAQLVEIVGKPEEVQRIVLEKLEQLKGDLDGGEVQSE